MKIYKLYKDNTTQQIACIMQLTEDVTSIPLCNTNTRYVLFKKEVLAGAELQDADGNVMTQEQANAFIETLP
jgi:hypothetical protein